MGSDIKGSLAEMATFQTSSFWESDIYNLFTGMWEGVAESYVI
jgi:hypothetical protein